MTSLLPVQPHYRSVRPDGAVAIGIYAAVLLLIPATQVLPGLRAVGTVAHAVAWVLLLWWVADWLAFGGGLVDPVSKAMAGFALVGLLSYAIGMTLALYDDQVRAADRGLVIILTGLGIVLVTAHGIRTVAQFHAVLTVLVCLGGVIAGFALLKFALNIDIPSAINVPLLRQTVTDTTMGDPRFGFIRSNSTAAHPIELGVVLAALIPLGLHLTVKAHRTSMALPTAVMMLAIPTTLSRSGLIALVLGLLIVMISWTWLERAVVLAVVSALGLLAVVARPGLGEGVVDLFTLAGNDDSILGRTSDYGAVGAYLQGSPVVGSGLGTFLPERFIILDNQYLLTLIDMGVVGLLALATLLGTAVVTTISVRDRSRSRVLSHGATALTASLVAVIISLSFFDALSFGMITGILWILLGLSGAAWQLTR